MPIAARTPVLVGAAAVQQRAADPATALDAVELMIDAAARAGLDAGAPELLGRAASVRVPRGLWSWPDPARLVAAAVGAADARTEVAEIGILQTTLFGRAAEAIAHGEEDVVLVVGGEARHREISAARAGVPLGATPQGPAEPDTVLRPHEEIVGAAEIEHGLLMPVAHYAVIENALRAAERQSLSAHRDAIAALWAAMSRVAAANPAAWDRRGWTPAELALPSERNPPLAFPYGSRHTSQWNVDQAAALVLCAAEVARGCGIPESRWIFPLAVTESNHMVPVAARPAMHRAPGFRLAGERAAAIAGVAPAEADHLELYSCFPVAVRVQQRELGVAPGRSVTECGGMTFAGGPLNNFVLQAMVRMVAVLRALPGSTALVTAVSGMLTKQGVSLWASRPPTAPCRFEDVTASVAAEVVPLPVAARHDGPATIASYTVLHEHGAPARAVAVCDVTGGSRAIASTTDAEAIRALLDAEGCGRRVVLAGPTLRL
jgi:acetyl-CoA C-acetyltransferase